MFLHFETNLLSIEHCILCIYYSVSLYSGDYVSWKGFILFLSSNDTLCITSALFFPSQGYILIPRVAVSLLDYNERFLEVNQWWMRWRIIFVLTKATRLNVKH